MHTVQTGDFEKDVSASTVGGALLIGVIVSFLTVGSVVVNEEIINPVLCIQLAFAGMMIGSALGALLGWGIEKLG